jgi:hypothetical protein
MPLTPNQGKHLEARLPEERARVNRETLQQEPGDRSDFHVNEAEQGTEAADEEVDDLNADLVPWARTCD